MRRPRRPSRTLCTAGRSQRHHLCKSSLQRRRKRPNTKAVMDRMRAAVAADKNFFRGKVGMGIVSGGDRNGGQEFALMQIRTFLHNQRHDWGWRRLFWCQLGRYVLEQGHLRGRPTGRRRFSEPKENH